MYPTQRGVHRLISLSSKHLTVQLFDGLERDNHLLGLQPDTCDSLDVVLLIVKTAGDLRW